MAVTPEGAIKKAVTELLRAYQGGVGTYYFMPVQGGFGPALLDYYGCHQGRFFAIETKAPGKSPTPRQTTIMASVTDAGGKVFVIDSIQEIAVLKAWLNGLID